jgi:uncharacterized protein with FMN-binding domain
MKSGTRTSAGLGAAAVVALAPVALPAAAVAAQAQTASKNHPSSKSKPRPKPKTQAKSQTYKGSLVRTIYSNVQVSITVSGKRIEGLSVSANPQDQQSYAREAYALPILRKEALKAQSYRIHAISGVTTTSEAFIESLYSAMGHAHLKR